MTDSKEHSARGGGEAVSYGEAGARGARLPLKPDVLQLVDAVAARHGLKRGDILSHYADRAATDCRDELFWRLNNRRGDRQSAVKIAGAFGYTRVAVQLAIKRHRRYRSLALHGAYD